MLDACPHHHEDAVQVGPDSEAAADSVLAGIELRTPGASKPLTGKRFWRSLDELAGTKSFETMLHREFPHAAAEWNDGPSRRNFLKLMGASMALAGLSACTLKKPDETIVPYVNPPEDVIPGRPLFFASTMPFAGYGRGVVVESHEGRPTKIEGNKDHPASLGSSDVFMQASILDLYDPDRSQTVRRANLQGGEDVSSWGEFGVVLADEIKRQLAGPKGTGLRFLTGTTTSPTFARMMADLFKDLPNAKWHTYEPVGRRNIKAGAKLAFGKDVQTLVHYEKADVVLALDIDFLVGHAASLVHARKFIDRRRIRLNNGADAAMNRLYCAESTVTLTGAKADHRLAIRSADIGELLRKIATVITGGAIADDAKDTSATKYQNKWAKAVGDDLKKAGKNGLLVVGETQPAEVHALVHAINETLGAVGTTVSYIDPVEVSGTGDATLEDLVTDMNAGVVDTLFILGTNPVYTAPADLNLSQGLDGSSIDGRIHDFTSNPLSKVKLVVNHGLYDRACDETAVFAHWHLPASHYLETWGDIRSFEGTASIIQPLIAPLYTTKSEIELLSMFRSVIDNKYELTGHDNVAATWTENGPKLSHDNWQRVLEKGVIPGTESKTVSVTVKPDVMGATTRPAVPEKEGAIELVFRPDPSVYDGRYTNNGWLQELPKPVSLLTWENVALMSVNTAKKLNVEQADQGKPSYTSKVKISIGDGPDAPSKIIPALIMPGHADNSITVYLGYGRARSGRVGKEIGVDVYAIRPAVDSWVLPVVGVELASGTAELATSQSHHLINLDDKDKSKLDAVWLEDRKLIQTRTLKEVRDDKKPTGNSSKPYRTIALALHPEEIPDSEKLIPGHTNYNNPTNNPNFVHDPNFNKWGMVIDNQACIGCNACVIACQSENNIAIVGKEQVIKGREMHWIRIDTYFTGEPDAGPEDSPDVYFQPIPCMNCENAPCTLVCPVEATTISEEGINEMTYNRCVGTRYCSNNCPYKVRRFNFLQFTDYDTAQFQLQRNPNVTVRSRGVMEKCNYCVQRVNNGRIEAKKQDRPIAPDEVITACAQACPTQAIVFGNLNDDRWDVTKLQDEPLRYTLLDELNTLPRTSYLSRVRNPNPVLEPAKVSAPE